MIFQGFYSPTNWRFCDLQTPALTYRIQSLQTGLWCSPSYLNPRSEAEIGKSSERRVRTPSRQYSKPIATRNVKNDRQIESKLNPTQPNPTRGWKRLTPPPERALHRRAGQTQISRRGRAWAVRLPIALRPVSAPRENEEGKVKLMN